VSNAKVANKVLQPQTKWAYDNGLEDYKMGPAFWKKSFEKCGSNAQSPIDINLPSTEYDSSFQAIYVKHSVKSEVLNPENVKWNITNRGFSSEI
jgi:carbonic anhydrase